MYCYASGDTSEPWVDRWIFVSRSVFLDRYLTVKLTAHGLTVFLRLLSHTAKLSPGTVYTSYNGSVSLVELEISQKNLPQHSCFLWPGQCSLHLTYGGSISHCTGRLL